MLKNYWILEILNLIAVLENKGSNIQGYYLCYYIPSKNDKTVLSNLLIDFKGNSNIDIVKEVCKWACNELSNKEIKITTIIRALSSIEIEADRETSLDALGNSLAICLNANYRPEILKKNRYTYPLKKIDIEKRSKEIENVYYTDYTFSKNDSILIIDDIYTTGTTINEIIRALRSKNPEMAICYFTVGKTSFQNDKNEVISLPGYLCKKNILRLEDAIGNYVLQWD